MIIVATIENSKIVRSIALDEKVENAVDKALVKCDLAALDIKPNQTVAMFQDGRLLRFIDGKTKKWKFTNNSMYF